MRKEEINVMKLFINEISMEKFEKEIYPRYLELFPKEERKELSLFKRMYEKGIQKIYEIVNFDKQVGFILLQKLPEYDNIYYLDYFAIYKKYQNQGYGTEAINTLINEISIDRNICLEVEKEGLGKTEEENNLRQRRVKFYKRLGFEKVNSEYLLFGVGYTPYVYNSKKHTLSKEEIDKIMFDFYLANAGEKRFKKYFKKIY